MLQRHRLSFVILFFSRWVGGAVSHQSALSRPRHFALRRLAAGHHPRGGIRHLRLHGRFLLRLYSSHLFVHSVPTSSRR